ncbi:MAG: ABC transporter permease [Sandarakinorhabdus sp.]
MANNLGMAFRALLQNRLQTLLTLLGVGVGVAMVVIVSGLGLGAQARIEEQIESAGPTMIVIRAGNYQPAGIATEGTQDSSGGEPSEGAVSGGIGAEGEFDLAVDAAISRNRARLRRTAAPMRHQPVPAPLATADIALLRGKVADIRAIAGVAEGNVTLDDAGSGKDAGGQDAGMVPTRIVRVSGFEAAWPEMRGWKLVEGRMITAREHANGAPLMVMAPAVARRLWPGAAPVLGKSLAIGGRDVTVVGLVDGTKDAEDELLPRIYTPLASAQAALAAGGGNRDTLDMITVRTTSVAVTTRAAKAIKAVLRAKHRLPDDVLDDFRVQTQSVMAMPTMGGDPRLARSVHGNVVGLEAASWQEMAKSLRAAGRTFTLLLAGAAAVSLLVGGIGVMNIMLVSVSARTREIGLRMAMGARAQDVMTQFLVEALALAGLGGAFGLVLGGLGLVFADQRLHWATAVSPIMLVLALGMAAIIGVAFGIGPARRAASLDPVVALRAE